MRIVRVTPVIWRWAGAGILAWSLAATACQKLDDGASPDVSINEQRDDPESGKQRKAAAEKPKPAPRAEPRDEVIDLGTEIVERPKVEEEAAPEQRAQRKSSAVKAPKLPSGTKTRRIKRVSEGSASMAVRHISIAQGVENRKPVGVSERFPASVDKLWAYVKVRNNDEPSHITMVWKHNDRVRSRVKLNVGTSASWRTWSTKRISPKDKGRWSVDVVDAEGSVLETINFQLTDPTG